MFESKPIKYDRKEYLAGGRAGMAKTIAKTNTKRKAQTEALKYAVQGRNGLMSKAPSLTKASTLGRMSVGPSMAKVRGPQKPTYKIPRKSSNGVGVGY